MTPKQESESRYRITAPADVPDQAIVYQPENQGASGGGTSEEDIRSFAEQSAIRTAINNQAWRKLVHDYQYVYRIDPPYPPKPEPFTVFVEQSSSSGEILIPAQGFVLGIPAEYKFLPEAWYWVWRLPY